MIAPGAGMGAVIALAMQEALVLGLHTLASDRRAIEELVGREDNLRHNTGDEWRKALADALEDMLNSRSANYCDVLIGYPIPAGKARLPAISITEQSGGENTAEAVTGDLIRTSTEFVGPDREVFETREFGCGHQTTLQIGVWATVPERSALLFAAVQWAIYQQKERLRQRGVHELTFRTGGVEIGADLDERVGFVPMVSATLSWTFRETRRHKVPNRVTIRTPVFSN